MNCLYVDQHLDGTVADTTTGSFANGNDTLIGAFNVSSPGTNRFLGDIAFARVSEGALSPADFVQPVPEPGAFLVIAMTFLSVSTRRRP